MKKIFSLFAAVLFAGSMMATTVTKTVAELAVEKSFTNSAVCTPFDLDEVISVSTSASDANTGKYYSNGEQIRLYQTGSATITLTAAEGYKISSITLTYVNTNTGILLEAESGVAVNFENVQSATFTVGNSGTATNGQVRITAFSVTYDADGAVPPTPACDWDNIAYAGNGSGNVAHNDRFKVCLGTPAPNFVNLQAPGWADEPGFYFEFPSAAWGAISLDAAEYKIQGAGIILYASAFLYDAEKEVTIVCQDVEYTITVMNNNPEQKPVVISRYEVAEAIAANLAENTEIEVRGIITKIEFKGANFKKYGSANIYVADATGALGEFEFYNCYSMNADTFRVSVPAYDPSSTAWVQYTEVSDENGYTIHVGDTVVAHGNYKLYNTTHELNTGCYIVYAKTPGAANPTAIDNAAAEDQAIKRFENGQLIIIKNGIKYNAAGLKL